MLCLFLKWKSSPFCASVLGIKRFLSAGLQKGMLINVVVANCIFTASRNMEERAGCSSTVRDEISSVISAPTSEEKKVIRKEYLAKKDATKICLYEQFPQWCSLKEDLKLKINKELAEVFLNNFAQNSVRNPASLR